MDLPIGITYCSACGQQGNTADAVCASCGAPREAPVSEPAVAAPPTAVSTAAVAPGAPGAQYIRQWNWGAALLAPYWLMAHRKVTLGIALFILQFVPVVDGGVSLIAFFYFGANGNRMAVASGRFQDDTQFVAVQNAWRNWAFVVAAFGILVLIASTIVRHGGT